MLQGYVCYNNDDTFALLLRQASGICNTACIALGNSLALSVTGPHCHIYHSRGKTCQHMPNHESITY